MLTIDLMTEDDVGFAAELTDIENWGNRQADFHRLIALEPEGCYIARTGGKRVGMVTTTTYGDYAFIGSLIVPAEHRGRGYGEKLMSHGLQYLRKRQIETVELDGTLAAVPLYRRLGFSDKYLSLRFRRERGPLDLAKLQSLGQSNLDDTGEAVDTGSSLEAVMALDRDRTGLDRSAVLAAFQAEFPGCFRSVGRPENSERSGYAAIWPRKGGSLSIGPLVALDDHRAFRLLLSIVAGHVGDVLTIGVPQFQEGFAETLAFFGFERTEPSQRMYLGGRRECETGVYGILSPEKG
jgi:ribosomal protein S18 acetylase RimI-like enzyme